METTFRLDEADWEDACVSLLFLLVTFASSCSFDESKLRAHSSRAQDGAIDHSGDADAVQAGTGGTMEVGRADSGSPDQAPTAAGVDAALGQDGQDGQDTSAATPDTAGDAAIDDSANADAGPAGTGGTMEVGQVDSGSPDQTPPAAGIDAAPGQDTQDNTDANPDTNTDINTGTGIVPDGTYRVIACHSGKALDVYFEVTADGSNVDQWTYDGGKNQQWTLTHLGGNVYEIVGAQSGKALEVATTSTADDTNVDIRTYAGATNQKWMISSASVGYFRLTPLSSSSSALDVSGVSLSDGANVHIWTWLGGSNYNQQWSFQLP